MKFVLILIACFAARAQTTAYPGAIDTNATLFVTDDNIMSVLTSGMSATDTLMQVGDGSRFKANMIATVCDNALNGLCLQWEHVFVTSVSGNTLTVQRGFAGTGAAPHAAQKQVAVLIDAVHQKVLKDAIIAIETALGPSGGLNNPSKFGINTGDLFNDPGNGAPPQLNYRRFAVADGSDTSPITAAAPTVVFERVDSSPSPLPFQFILTKRGGGGFTYANSTWVRQTDNTATDTVAVAGRIRDESTSPAPNQTIWAGWFQVYRTNSAQRAAGIEIDVANETGVDSPDPGPGCTAGCSMGMQVVAVGNKDASDGIEFVTGDTAKFKRGLYFAAGSISQYGIDLSGMGTAGISPLRLPNNTFIHWTNATAGSIDQAGIGVGGDNTLRLRNSNAFIFLDGLGSTQYARILPNSALVLGTATGTLSKLHIDGLPGPYDDNVTAGGAGLAIGDVYRSSAGCMMVRF